MITEEDIELHGNTNVDYLYSLVSSFEDFQTLNVAFLKGILPSTIYHLGQLHEETEHELDDLIKLNEKGFITINSQPGIHKFDSTPTDYYEIEQKPYIEGFCHRDYLPALQQFLTKQSPNIYFRINSYNERSPVLYYDNFPKCPYNLTRDRSHPDSILLRDTPWRLYTNLHRQIWADRFGTHYSFWENMIFVFIAGKEYCQKFNISAMLNKFFNGID